MPVLCWNTDEVLLLNRSDQYHSHLSNIDLYLQNDLVSLCAFVRFHIKLIYQADLWWYWFEYIYFGYHQFGYCRVQQWPTAVIFVANHTTSSIIWPVTNYLPIKKAIMCVVSVERHFKEKAHVKGMRLGIAIPMYMNV